MLFVGYSLSDEDFHSIVRQVRQARSGAEGVGKIGTVIALVENPIFTELWSEDLDVLSMASEVEDVFEAERRLQIFLDRLCLEAADLDAFLLDPIYDTMLDPDELTLKGALAELREHADGKASGWEKVRRLISDFGG